MSTTLELYLEELKQRLKSLPARERETELREIESHLRSMIEAREVSGVPQREAVNEALLQFGTTWHIGRDLTYVYAQRQKESPLLAVIAALGAIGCQAAFIQLYNWIVPLLAELLYNDTQRLTPENILIYALTTSFFLSPVPCGMLAQRIAPQRGWWAALVAYLVGIVVLCITCQVIPKHVAFWEITPMFVLPLGSLVGSWWSKRRVMRKSSREIVGSALN